MTRLAVQWRTSLTLMVLAVFSTVVAAGTLFACPSMQAPSCCSKSQPDRHCSAENPGNCVLAVSEDKIVTARPKLTVVMAPAAAFGPSHPLDLAADPVARPLEAQRAREIHLLNRVLRI